MQTTKEFDTLRIILEAQAALIYDQSDSIRETIRSAMCEWGIPSARVFVTGDVTEAEGLLQRVPTIFFVDFSFDAGSAHNLLEKFVSMHPEARRVGIVCDSRGAKKFVSEGAADGFLEKPFDRVALRQELKRAMLLKFYPDSYMKKILRADEMVRQGKTELAIAEYESARSINPEPHRAYRGLAEIHHSAGRWSEALHCYKQARVCLPVDYQTMVGELKAYRASGDEARAQSHLAELILEFPHVASKF